MPTTPKKLPQWPLLAESGLLGTPDFAFLSVRYRREQTVKKPTTRPGSICCEKETNQAAFRLTRCPAYIGRSLPPLPNDKGLPCRALFSICSCSNRRGAALNKSAGLPEFILSPLSNKRWALNWTAFCLLSVFPRSNSLRIGLT